MKVTLNGNELELTDEQVKKIVKEYKPVGEKTVGFAIKSRWVSATVVYQSTKSNLRDAVMEAIESDTNLSGADLRGANLCDTNLSGADLSGTNLRGANLRDADLSGANLSDANLSDTNLRGADLSDANLRDADLRRANLRDANLSDTNLRGADLSDTDLSDADLSGTDLRGAELENAKFYGKGGTKPLKRSQLPDFLAALGFIIED